LPRYSAHNAVEKVLYDLEKFGVRVDLDYRTYEVLVVESSGAIRAKVIEAEV
jgi:hypothetical protein